MPLVSVILPNYNHAPFLSERIESILNQKYDNFELIILDDASTDNSVEVIEKYSYHPKISHFIKNDKNSGSTFKQWEKGINLAEGKYIWVAESDDIADSTFLETIVQNFENDPKLGIIYTPSIWIDDKSLTIHTPQHESFPETWSGNEVRIHEFLKGNLIYNASSAVFKKELLSNVDFNAIRKFKYTGDWMFWVQLSTDTYIARLDKRMNYFRRHTNNVSFKSEEKGLQFSEGLQVIDYIFKTTEVGFVKKRLTLLFWAKKIASSKLSNASQILQAFSWELSFYHNLLKVLK